MSNYTEEEIYATHAGVAKSLQHTISYFQNRRRELMKEIKALQSREQYIRDQVVMGRWYDLEGYLEEPEIELLCEVEPTDRLSLINEPWE